MARVVRGLALLWAAALAACGAAGSGDGSGQADAAPGGRPIDAAIIPPADARPDGCLDYVPDDWGANGPIDEHQSAYPEGDYTYFADMVPDTEPFFQRLFISLHPDQGVFTGGAVEAGTYLLEGDEIDHAWCGACVYLAVEDGDTPSTLYHAQSGKLTIDSVGGGEIHGTLESAELVQIDIVFNGPSCAGWEDPDPWPCGNEGCSGSNDLCGVPRLVPDCTTRFDSLDF